MNHLTASWARVAIEVGEFNGDLYLDPEMACGKCYAAAKAYALEHGGKVVRFSGPLKADRQPPWYDPEDEDDDFMLGHAAVLVGDMIIDFTARQFWTDAPVPLVESLATYKRRFERYDGVDHI